MSDERAVSDVVAFVLSFSLIITSVAFTSVLGFADIADRSANIQSDSADNAMQGLAHTFADIHRQGAESRSSELRLGGGSLQLNDSVRFEVAVNGNTIKEFETQSLEYRSSDSLISYENGAVFRRNRAGGTSLLRSEPAISCRGDTAIVSILSLTSDEGLSTSGQGSVVVTAVRKNQTLLVQSEDDSNPDSVSISVSDSAHDWDTYFDPDDSNSKWTEPSPSTYKCTGLDHVYVRQTTIEIDATT